MPTNPTRRRFLQSATAAALSTTIAPAILRAANAAEKPARKLSIALVGIGGRGMNHLDEVAALPNASIDAICEVDSDALARAAKKLPNAKGYVDFRDALKHPGIEAVICATPDHTHAVIAAAAMRTGLHVYCEKPLAHTVHETRVLTTLAAENPHLCTQLGIQIHSLENYRRVVELLRAGAIGPIREVHIWNGRSNRAAANTTVVDPPANLNYDLWLGPVAHRPYHPDFHPFNWRRYWSFGEGLMGDIGCHYLDLPFWALGLRHPTRISATSPSQPAPDPDITPDALIVRYEFPKQDSQPPVTLTWYDPPHRPKEFDSWSLPKDFQKEAAVFVGESGLLVSGYTKHALLPEDRFKDYARPAKSIPSSPGQQGEWVNACLAKDPSLATCPFSYGGPLTETALLGPIAYRAGQALDWDATAMRFPNHRDAEQLLRTTYREGWTL